MLKEFKTKQTSISVTDLASYVADTPAFIKYKKQGITAEQKKIGNNFHDSLHTSNRTFGITYVLLAFVIIGFIVLNIFLSDSFSIF
jgi:hypothetical protein